MIEGSCHCGAVRLAVPREPAFVLDCNCSICRRHGALWCYFAPSEVSVTAAPGATVTYMWGDRMLVFHHCATCFCFTHFWPVRDSDADAQVGVNARMLHGLDPRAIPLVQKNNGNDGVFWTKTDLPVLPSHDLPS